MTLSLQLPRASCAALAIAGCALLASLDARAATVEARSVGTAGNTCQAALPAYEGQIRKRPLSVQNEGSAPAFVTCSMAAGGYATRSYLYANSIDGQAHTLTCTAVIGYVNGNPKYVSKNMDVSADGEQSFISVLPADVGRTTDVGSDYVSYSCLVPAGAGINDTGMYWNQEIGS